MKPESQGGLYKNGIKNVRNYFQIPSLLSVHMIKDMEYHNNFYDFHSHFYTYLTYPAESALNSVNYTKGLAGYYDLDQGAKIFLDMIYVPKGILQI